MNVREKRSLLQAYPFLRHFFIRQKNKTYTIKRYAGCWFLEDGGLCSIQRKFGYSHKPFICRLDPFYIARCQNEYVVTQGLYPCHMLRLAKGKTGISHKQILKNAREAIDYDNLTEEVNWPIERLNLEKEILAASKAFLSHANYLDFAAYQISTTIKNKDIAEIKSKLLDSISLWKSFLGVDGLILENKRLAYELTAFTSLLRMESPLLRQMPAEKVPLALLGLYFYILLFTKTNKPKTYVQTYQQILSDIAFGLLYLKNEDLEIKKLALENRIMYLRKLGMLQIKKLIQH